MEVEDFFSSPTTDQTVSEWKEKVIAKVDCDCVKNIFISSKDVKLIAVKDSNWIVLVYTLPNFNLEIILDLKNYTAQEAVLSSCKVSSMSSSLKCHFQEHFDTVDTEIIVIGLNSGLILWFYSNTPVKGPFVLFYAYQKIQNFHWIQDASGDLFTHLLIILSSGQVIIFGDGKQTTLYLPDSVKSSYVLKNLIITSNYIDCYSSELKINKDTTLNCVSLPLKGVSALSNAPGSETLLMAATMHGSVYCVNPAIVSSEVTTHFTLPDQSLLDNMFIQTQNLEKIYKQLNEEEGILKAVTAAIAANCTQDIFYTSIRVISDAVFIISVKMLNSKTVFSQDRWLTCVEVTREVSFKETRYFKMEQDYSSNNDLTVKVDYGLCIDDVVAVELISFLENQHPLLTVSLGKVKIDPLYLLIPQTMVPIATKPEDSLENILLELNDGSPNETIKDQKLILRLGEEKHKINSCLPLALHNSRHRFSSDEWEKLSGGKKFSVHGKILNTPLLLSLETETGELTIISCSVTLCYQVKETIINILKNPFKRHISENLTMDIEALHQSFEIESLRNETNLEELVLLKKDLRLTVSANLPL